MTTYVVWRRNDGHVSCSCNRLPEGWKSPMGEVTFTYLRTFDEWNAECIDFINAEQEKSLHGYKAN